MDDKIKAVIFDHDDTLVGTIGSKFAEHKFIAKEYYGKDLSDEDIKKHWGKPLHEMICLLYETDDVDQAMAYNVKHHNEYPKPIFPETVAALKRIKAQGKLTGVVTATSRYSFNHDIHNHKIADLLDFTQTADDTEYHKPDKRVFDPLIKWLKDRSVKPNETLYVGDAFRDAEAAIGAGFNFLGVETGLVTAEQFTAEGYKSIPNLKNFANK
jgi:phosphoglycolate phosphatase